ncbi:MAG TPA: hypothetical protein VEA59_03930 [Patescibacteria group bacterium]|nr:hypothetical protein [Patescibacteria group bacterium]
MQDSSVQTDVGRLEIAVATHKWMPITGVVFTFAAAVFMLTGQFKFTSLSVFEHVLIAIGVSLTAIIWYCVGSTVADRTDNVFILVIVFLVLVAIIPLAISLIGWVFPVFGYMVISHGGFWLVGVVVGTIAMLADRKISRYFC